MINRRHIRIKVMQSMYAFIYGGQKDFSAQETFLKKSLHSALDLYMVMLYIFFHVQKNAKQKHLISESEAISETISALNKIFATLPFFEKLAQNPSFKKYLSAQKLDYQEIENNYAPKMYHKILKSELFLEFAKKPPENHQEQMFFLAKIYRHFLADDAEFYDFLEAKNFHWIDDMPFVNTHILRLLQHFKSQQNVYIPKMYKSEADKNFAMDLLKKTALNHFKFEENLVKIIPNWDLERIARLDMILIKMGIVEFKYFPEIPVRATLNEYVEISKEYASEKSAIFINGILDRWNKVFENKK